MGLRVTRGFVGTLLFVVFQQIISIGLFSDFSLGELHAQALPRLSDAIDDNSLRQIIHPKCFLSMSFFPAEGGSINTTYPLTKAIRADSTFPQTLFEGTYINGSDNVSKPIRIWSSYAPSGTSTCSKGSLTICINDICLDRVRVAHFEVERVTLAYKLDNVNPRLRRGLTLSSKEFRQPILEKVDLNRKPSFWETIWPFGTEPDEPDIILQCY